MLCALAAARAMEGLWRRVSRPTEPLSVEMRPFPLPPLPPLQPFAGNVGTVESSMKADGIGGIASGSLVGVGGGGAVVMHLEVSVGEGMLTGLINGVRR